MKQVTYLAAVALAIGSCGLIGCKDDRTTATGQKTDAPATTDARTPGQKVNDAITNAGDKAGQMTDATTRKAQDLAGQVAANVSPTGADKITGIQSNLEGIVENAAKRNNWGALAGYLTKSDEQRVNQGKPDTKDVDDLADKFTSMWNDKYGDKFVVMKAGEIYNADFVTLTPTSEGSQTATAMVKASHGMPDLQIPFVTEGGLWKMNIPDTVTSQQLHDNLLTAWTELQDLSKLPATKVDAYRHVSHRLLMAVNGK